MKEIRREHKRHVAQNPWSGHETYLGHEQTDHVLSDKGGLESLTQAQSPVSSCGCIAPPAGYCAPCIAMGLEGTVCQACKGICGKCHKPICPRHSKFEHPASREPVRLCEECFDSLKRKHSYQSALRSFFSPFIDFGDRQ